MGRSVSVLALEFPIEEIKRLLCEFAKEKGDRHAPSAKSVKSVMLALGIRQRSMPRLYKDLHVTNESVPQLSKALDLKKGTVDDVLAFLTWTGLCRTIKKGGGKGKNPTVRRLEIEDYESGGQKTGAGEDTSGVGISTYHDGEQGIHDGELPGTPLVQPLLKPVCEPTDITAACEEGYGIEELIAAYNHEIERTVILGADLDTFPDEFQHVDTATATKATVVESRSAVDPKEACLRSVRAIASKYTVKSVYSIG